MNHAQESYSARSGRRPAPPDDDQPDGHRTPHPSVELASWPARVGAKLIDTLAVGVPSLLAYFVGELCIDAGESGSAEDDSGGLVALGILFYVISTVVGTGGWLWVMYQMGTTGQSIGKRRMNISLVSETTGRPIGFGRTIVYELAQIIDAMPLGIGYLWPLYDKKRQTFSDKIMSTLAVRV